MCLLGRYIARLTEINCCPIENIYLNGASQQKMPKVAQLVKKKLQYNLNNKALTFLQGLCIISKITLINLINGVI